MTPLGTTFVCKINSRAIQEVHETMDVTPVTKTVLVHTLCSHPDEVHATLANRICKIKSVSKLFFPHLPAVCKILIQRFREIMHDESHLFKVLNNEHMLTFLKCHGPQLLL